MAALRVRGQQIDRGEVLFSQKFVDDKVLITQITRFISYLSQL